MNYTEYTRYFVSMSEDLGSISPSLSEFTVSRALASILWMDEHGKIYFANQTAVEQYGYSKEEFEKLSLFDINRNYDPKLFDGLWARSKKELRVYIESSHWRKDGSEFPVEIFINHVEWRGKRYNVSFILDISQRKRKEQLLTSVSEATSSTIGNDYFKSLVKNITQALDVTMCFVTLRESADDRYLKTLAYFKNGEFKEDVTYEMDGTPCKQVIESKLAYYQPIDIQKSFPKEDGLEGYFGVPILSNKGDCLGNLAIFNEGPLLLQQEEQEIIRMFSDRAGAELERDIANEKLINAISEVEQLKNKLEAENTYLQEEIQLEHNFEEIITRSVRFKAVLANLEQVAVTNATVLITGESGTGKELMARAIHNISPRSNRPLVKVNCAALPANLIESELFGHEKGAFTGAVSRKAGRFELADGGTIFLDEIGELPIELQSKLLRALQEGEFERVGGAQTLKVDVRVIAATNRDLENEIEEGNFRSDLFYRLNVFPVHSLPLRERREDIPILVKHFTDKFGARIGRSIDKVPKRLINTLKSYDWPGNIRELENIIERGVILSSSGILELGDWLPSKKAVAERSELMTMEEYQRDYIIHVLQKTSWRVSGEKGAAKVLGMKPTTLESRMKKLGIKRGE